MVENGNSGCKVAFSCFFSLALCLSSHLSTSSLYRRIDNIGLLVCALAFCMYATCATLPNCMVADTTKK